MSDKLKPLKNCPFCGKSSVYVYNPTLSDNMFYVWCCFCNASGPDAETWELATTAWNRREGEK